MDPAILVWTPPRGSLAYTAATLGLGRRDGAPTETCDRAGTGFRGAPYAPVPASRRSSDSANPPNPAETRYWLSWHHGDPIFDGEVFRFDPETLTMDYSAEIRLPAWRPSAPVPPSKAALWDRYLCLLMAHEGLHLDVGRRAVLALLREAARLQAPDSEALVARFDSLAESVLTWAGAEDERLDRETCHGPILDR